MAGAGKGVVSLARPVTGSDAIEVKDCPIEADDFAGLRHGEKPLDHLDNVSIGLTLGDQDALSDRLDIAHGLTLIGMRRQHLAS